MLKPKGIEAQLQSIGTSEIGSPSAGKTNAKGSGGDKVEIIPLVQSSTIKKEDHSERSAFQLEAESSNQLI